LHFFQVWYWCVCLGLMNTIVWTKLFLDFLVEEL
jgi:hypothetical protein